MRWAGFSGDALEAVAQPHFADDRAGRQEGVNQVLSPSLGYGVDVRSSDSIQKVYFGSHLLPERNIMRDLDLTTLRLFVSVCETRSIARAGEQASIVGSAISKRLAQLEDTVGTPLLLRKRRGVAPTPAGETLLEHARAMLGSAHRIERDMAAYAGGARGHVRILASASVMAESLAEDVAEFLQNPAHRDIRVDMEERVSPEIVRGIREGSASIGLCWDAADLRRPGAARLPLATTSRSSRTPRTPWHATRRCASRRCSTTNSSACPR
jgi:DNA-binding transcriptional LysR family regulator